MLLFASNLNNQAFLQFAFALKILQSLEGMMKKSNLVVLIRFSQISLLINSVLCESNHSCKSISLQVSHQSCINLSASFSENIIPPPSTKSLQ